MKFAGVEGSALIEIYSQVSSTWTTTHLSLLGPDDFLFDPCLRRGTRVRSLQMERNGESAYSIELYDGSKVVAAGDSLVAGCYSDTDPAKLATSPSALMSLNYQDSISRRNYEVSLVLDKETRLAWQKKGLIDRKIKEPSPLEKRFYDFHQASKFIAKGEAETPKLKVLHGLEDVSYNHLEGCAAQMM